MIPPASNVLSTGNPPRLRDWGIMLLIAGAFFGMIAPTLTWLEFSSGSENLNVATALEIRRENKWLIPHLHGEPRLRKPPLTAWITATLIRQSTLDAISSDDPQINRKGYQQLAWDVRWPALLLMSLAAAAVYELGRLAGGWQLGLLAAIVFATNYAVLRFGRYATTDVQLTFWVIVANVFLMWAMQLGQLWLGMIGMHGTYRANMSTSECDLLVAVGVRFDDRVTGKIDAFAPKAQIVHIDIDPTSIQKNVSVQVPLVADCKQALAALKKIYPDVDIASHIIGDPITVSWEADPHFLGAFKGALPGHYRYNHRMYGHFMQDGLPAAERGIFLAGDDISFTPAWVEGAVQTSLNAVWGIVRHLGGGSAPGNPGPGDLYPQIGPVALPD
jgi:hypothetical protein